MGYDIAVGAARISGDISAGLITGGAASGLSKAGIYGRYASYAVRGFDAAGNATEFGRGIGNASVNGLTWQNSLQMAGAGLGTVADFADLAPSIRGFGNGVAPSGKSDVQLYSYYEGSMDATRPFTASSGRVYMTTRAPGEWLTKKGVSAGVSRFVSTGRYKPYSSSTSYFTTGKINPSEWDFSPILPRTGNFWKTIGGQYQTGIGTSGFLTTAPGCNLLINSRVSSNVWQTTQSIAGTLFETTPDVMVIGGVGTGIYFAYPDNKNQ